MLDGPARIQLRIPSEYSGVVAAMCIAVPRETFEVIAAHASSNQRFERVKPVIRYRAPTMTNTVIEATSRRSMCPLEGRGLEPPRLRSIMNPMVAIAT